MAKKLLALLLILAFLIVAGLEVAGRLVRARIEAARRAPAAPAAAPRALPAGRMGERIEYEVRMGAIKIGSSVFTQLPHAALNDAQVMVFLFTTDIVHLDDTEKIYADPSSMLPVRVERSVSIWPRKEKIVERYDQKNHTVVITKNGRNQEIQSPLPMQNAVLLPFVIRECGQIGKGWSRDVNLPTQKFKVILAGTEKVKVPAGEFEVYHFVSDPDKFEVWVTTDNARIPVRIRGTGALGYTMLMSGYTPPSQEKK